MKKLSSIIVLSSVIFLMTLLTNCPNPMVSKENANNSVASTFTVTYNGNGNESGAVPVDTNRYTSGQTVKILGNTGSLAKTNYNMDGWNTASDGSGAYYYENQTFQMGNANVTLYAIFEPNVIAINLNNVTYNANGATGGSVPVDLNKYTQGQTVTILGNTGNLINSGNNFSGWNTAADGSGTTYSQGQSFIIGNTNVTLYAVWSSNPIVTIAMPVFNVAAGYYTTTQSVTISCPTSGAIIYYTTDGITEPTTASSQYKFPITVGTTVAGGVEIPKIIKAKAFKDGFSSGTATVTYHVMTIADVQGPGTEYGAVTTNLQNNYNAALNDPANTAYVAQNIRDRMVLVLHAMTDRGWGTLNISDGKYYFTNNKNLQLALIFTFEQIDMDIANVFRNEINGNFDFLSTRLSDGFINNAATFKTSFDNALVNAINKSGMDVVTLKAMCAYLGIIPTLTLTTDSRSFKFIEAIRFP